MARERRFLDIVGKVMASTQKHRAAIWEAMLGTVYAANDQGMIENFDYDYEGARGFAGIESKKDIRIHRRCNMRCGVGCGGDWWKLPKTS